MSLHYSRTTTLSDGTWRLDWLARKYKPDFIATLQRCGTIPAQTTSDVLLLADALKEKDLKIREQEIAIQKDYDEITKQAAQLNEALHAN